MMEDQFAEIRKHLLGVSRALDGTRQFLPLGSPALRPLLAAGCHLITIHGLLRDIAEKSTVQRHSTEGAK